MNSVISESTQSALTNWEQVNALSQIALAFITSMAVIGALFQEKINKWLTKAKIRIEIVKNPPDCHQILLTNPQTGQPAGNAIYVRLRLTNETVYSSHATEVFISNFWKLNEDNVKEVIKTFLPMNLKWSHTHEISAKVLPKIYRYCDFGAFRSHNGETILLLDTIVQPNPVSGGRIPNLIEKGKYVFEVVVSGDNIDQVKKQWKLFFDGVWSEDETEMLTKHIEIKEVKHE